MTHGPRIPITQQSIEPSPYFRWKAGLGRVLAALLLLPGIPIMLVLILIVRLTSRGPGVYRQMRVGKGGRTYWMYKIRTMRCDAESDGAQWTQENDPRITRVGRVFRKLHLDEFPQLINVVRGEMDLIGPRPERPEFIQVLAREIPGYLDRLAVLPGVTGLAQINLPPDSDLDSVRRKLVLDREYIETATLLLDLRMFVSTLLRMFGMRGELAMKVMGLERHVKLSSETAGSTTPDVATPGTIVQGDSEDDDAEHPVASDESEEDQVVSQPVNGHNGVEIPLRSAEHAEHLGVEPSQR